VAPLKLCHVKPTLQGHYQLTAFSTDSLRMRNLDVAMQVIPEEDDENDSSCRSNSLYKENQPGMMISNPELGAFIDDKPQVPGRRRQRLLQQFRKMFRLSSLNARSANTSADPDTKKEGATDQMKSLPGLINILHRRRS
jgi:hypothetical protein